MQLSFVASSPMGTIVTDPRDNQKYVLVPYQFAQKMFRNSKYLMDFEAEYRVQELLPAEEFVSLDAVSTKADLPHKVFIGVRGEGEDQVSYILQEESLDDEPVYRILYVMEEVDMDELETFNAVVIGRKPKGYAATAVMYQKMLEQAELQETLLHLESAVRLGLITEEEIMQKMIQKFGAEDRDESERMTRAEAEALANKVSDMLEPYTDFVEVCGSYRRGREDPGDLDVVVILKEGITLPEIVAELEGNYEKYNWLGEKKTQLVIDGVKVDIKVSTPTGIGAALLYFTGPSGYNIGMRSAAKRKGFKLNEYGLFDRDTNEYLGGATEEEIYDLLGRTYKPPEMRAESRESKRKRIEEVTDFPNHHFRYGEAERLAIEFPEGMSWKTWEKRNDARRELELLGSKYLKKPMSLDVMLDFAYNCGWRQGISDEKTKTYRSEEGSAPIQRPMEFGEPVNWTPLDGTPSLKRRRDAESLESSDADLFWLWLSDEDLVFHRLLARMYRSKNFGFLRDAGARQPRQFTFEYLGYNEDDIQRLKQPILSFEERNDQGLENISFQMAEFLLNWVEMAADDVGMPEWTSEDMVVAVDLGNSYDEDFVYLIFPDGSEMQIETFNVEKGFPKESGSFPDLTLAPIPSRVENGEMLIWTGELKVVAINDREPYSFKDGQV